MAVPNPYFIYIELLWPDMTRPTQNQIARVRAFDVESGVATWEGESGFNPNTGGWYPVYMQNIAAFYPPREKPNLRFEVWNTAEQVVHTTQIFNAIASASTVRIIIGVSAEIVGDGNTAWLVSGTVRHEDSTPLTAGTVRAFDITSGSEKELGSTTLGAGGTYSIGYTTADFATNGAPHAQPNLKVRVFSATSQLLGESSLVTASNNQIIDVTVPNETGPGPGPGKKRRVFGVVQNTLGLPVAGILVEAYHLAWTVQGLQEFPLGPLSPPTASDGSGAYEILYDLPLIGTPASPCGTPADQINLIVYAKEAAAGGGTTTLFTSEAIFDAPEEQRVDPIVNKPAVSTDSEYRRVDEALTPCLGETEGGKWDTLNKLNTRPEYLLFVAKATGIEEALVRAYVRAWLIAGEINAKVPAAALSRPMSPEVIYALLRVLEATSLPALLNVTPGHFFEAIVRAVHRGIVAALLELALYPSAEFGDKSLLDDWRTVLAKLMNQSGLSWQAPLLRLVFPDVPIFPEALPPTGTSFGTAVASHPVPMPSGIAAGDLLLVLFANRGASGTGTAPPPNGWTTLWSATSGATNPVRFSGFAKQATGSEAGTVDFTTSIANQAAAQVYRIPAATWRGDLSDGVEASTTVSATGTSLNPPALTPPQWGARKHLWLACAAHAREHALTASPADYTPSPALRTSSSVTIGNCTALSARRPLEAAAEDPGSFTIAASADGVTVTLAIREGSISLAGKREAVVEAHFNHQGSFDELVTALEASGTITGPDAQNLRFVFELYERVGRYYPIVAAVYAQKDEQGWLTIGDLASVPFEATGTQNHWVAYALSSQSFSNGTFPLDVPGNTADEKARVYAARLFELFREAAAQEGFATDLTEAAGSDPVLQEIVDFLSANPTFDLERTNVEQYAAESTTPLSDDAIDKLKQLQRVYRLTADYEAANALILAGLDSAVKVARLDEGQFIADYEEVVGGLTAARNIHRVASHYATEVMFTLVKFHQNLNAVGGMTAVPGPVDFTVLDPTEGLVAIGPTGPIVPGGSADTRKLPNWITLFGDLNQCACKHCQTVLSPGAYLVDLLEFVDGAPRRTLFERRPDLEDIELTCPNTNTVLPYIDLVNEVLEAVVAPLRFTLTLSPNVPDVLDDASAGATEIELQIAMDEVRGALAAAGFVLGERALVKRGAPDRPPSYREWVIEDDAWRFSIRQTGATFTVYPAPQTSASNDSLEVFPEHFNAGAYDKLREAVFPFNLPLELGREETEVFLRAKNVSRHQILEAFNVESAAAMLTDPELGLAYLRLTQAEARALLALDLPARAYWGFSSDSATIPRPDKPTLTVSGNWVHLMALVPVFLHRSGLRYPELLELIDTEYVHRFAEGLIILEGASHGLHIAGPAEALLECNSNDFQIAHLTAPVLQRISVFIRLWRKLGWSMRDVDRYLIDLEGNEIPLPDPESAEVGGRLLRLYHFQRLAAELKLSPRALMAFWRPIDTRRTLRNPKSWFDEVFLVGSPTQPEILALEQVARGGVLELDSLPPDQDVRAHVRAALRLKAEDIELLWDELVGTGPGLTLDIEKLSGIYRRATLCAALGLTPAELLDLETLVGLSVLPASSVDPTALRAAMLGTHAALREIAAARMTQLPAAELLYYLTGAAEADDAFVPSTAELDAAVQRLATAAGEIAAANPEQTNPDAVSLGAALAKVMPEDKVVRALRVIELPDAGDTEQVAFVQRYFGVFSATAPAVLLGELAALGQLAERQRRIWDALHGYLVEQARATTAITVAAELTGTDEDTANTLLTQSLHRPGDTSVSALEDWKAMLHGGWSSGEPALVDAGPGLRTGTLVVAQPGEHRFVASVAATSDFTVAISIEVDGVRRALTLESPTELVFEPVTLRAGRSYPLSVEYTYTGSQSPAPPFTLLFRVGNADPVLLPSTAVVPFEPEAYTKLFKAVRLARGLRLTKLELRHVIENPSVLDLDALPVSPGAPAVPWPSLASLLERLDLNRSVRLKNGTLFELWRDAVDPSALPPTPTLADVAIQTGWKEEDLQAVSSLWSPAPAWDDPGLWLGLRAAFTVIRRLDIRASQILALLVQGEPSITTAGMLRNVFRAQLSRDAWKEIFKPLRDPLRQRQRDALVGYLTSPPVPLEGGGTFIDANDLFAHFLIDVEMEPDTLISRVKLALNVVQLFVHRVFLGLENAASLGELDKKKDQWAWMDKYRVWEANRKVFLYPENWIEPELRDDKTEFFTELEDELLQGELSFDTAAQALTSYLEKMTEVSNLEIIGAFAEGNSGSGASYFLHVVGRTRFRSRSMFYRTFQGRQAHDGIWSPWKRINLEIEADAIAPVVVNGRLHLFWTQVLTKEKPNEYDRASEGDVAANPNAFSSQQRAQYQAEIRLMRSELIAKNNKWTKPKLTKSRGMDENAPTPFTREIGEDQARTENYHLRVAFKPDHLAIDLIKTNIPVESGSLDPRLLGTFQIWHTGDDSFVAQPSGGQPQVLASNWPVGTVLKHNAAFETAATIDNLVSNDTLAFKGNAAFLARTPGDYRIFEPNFNYLSTDSQPFFYETLTKSLFAIDKGSTQNTSLSQETARVARLSTFHHPLVQKLEEKLYQFGLEGLMHRLTQALPVVDDRYYANYYYNYYYGSLYLGYHIAGDSRALYTTQRMFEQEHAPGQATVQPLYPLPTVEFGYGTSFGIYNWELFFHVPMLIAGRLSQDLKFEDALRWHHYVFDPKQELNKYERTRRWATRLPVGCRYWNFLPFFANRSATDSLLDTLGLTKTLSHYDREQLSALIDESRNNPFNPHLIARQRISAYQKFVVMKYLDNLIAWADSLFRQDTFETINEATQLYILADELLGGRPEEVEPLTGEPRFTYRELRAKGIDDFSNAIVEVESLIVSNQPHLKSTELAPVGSSMTPLKNLALKTFYFKIPRNERLDRYWDLVDDRLFKIRNSMNIDGVKRRLALFEPPIDPALLVRAAAAGLDIGSVLAQLNAPLPCYRFNVWIQKATELCNELQGFGAALLAALEKKDAEELQLLRQNQEIRMLGLVRRVRQQQITEAEANIKALELSRTLAEERHEYYRSRSKISSTERAQVDKTKAATKFEIVASAAHAVSALFAPVPDSKAGMVGPFPSGLIDLKIGTALQSIANASAHVASAFAASNRGDATLAGINAGHERRWDEWKFQERLALKEINQLNQQIAVAAIRLDIAQKELDNHEQQIEHAEELREFLQDKFTSRELYQWMVSQVTRTYNQVYKLAYDAARTAERNFEFELGVSGAGFIQFGYIDSLRQGLLAGEKLIHDLKRLDVAYLERNKRELEIQKPISLAAFDGEALQRLRETGACEFELPEVLFDLDFPGHYFRRIKGVRLTIPCVTGPHTSVSAKLSLLGSAYRKEGAANPDAYAYDGFDDARFVHDPIGIQGIATSRAQGDPGLFELSFRDERYLPFEGAGAISRWRLELPEQFRQFDYHTISDVVMELSYTARDGGGLLKQGAENAIRAGLNRIRELALDGLPELTGLVRVFSLRKEFPDVFHRLLTEQTAVMTLLPEHFPFVLRHARLGMSVVPDGSTVQNPIDVHVVPKSGVDLEDAGASIELNTTGLKTLAINDATGVGVATLSKGGVPNLLNGWAPEDWTLTQSNLTAAYVEDIVLIAKYAVPE